MKNCINSVELEREVIDTRNTAVEVVLSIIKDLKLTPNINLEIASKLEIASAEASPTYARIARLIVAAIRDQEMSKP